MSKLELKRYLNSLEKPQLQEQILELYEKFKEVKRYYKFAFNPQENKLIEECKFKISKEYFPTSGRKPKARRSVAQKQIKLFIQLGVDPALIADVMLYNIEIAQAFSSERIIKQDSFYLSMLKSYTEAVNYCKQNGLVKENSNRIRKIAEEAWSQKWFNSSLFEKILSATD